MKNTLQSLSLAFLILLMAGWQAFAAEKMSDTAFSSVLQQIQIKGETTVLVELYPSDMQLMQSDKLPDSMRKMEVARVQQRLQASMIAEDLDKISHQYEFVPGVAVRVNTETLKRLQQNQYIKAIYENGMRKPSLSQSTRVVFPDQATSKFTGNNEWAVAVLDTGVDKNHSFLKSGGTSKVISEACYSRGGFASNFPEIDSFCPGEGFSSTAVNSGLNCSGYFGCDHGTHVAGIAAGDGSTFNGVASEGKLIAIQVFTGLRDFFNVNVCGTGVGQSCIVAFDVDTLKALERVYALRNTFKIASVNMSLGSGGFPGSCNNQNALVTNAITNLKNAGIATVVASGNSGLSSSISFPACISNAIAVGATFDSGAFIDRPTSYSNESGMLDLYAPGSFIVSSVPGGGFGSKQGTSMAAPHVAGAWALLKHAKPSGTVDEFESVLKSVGPNVLSRNRLVVRKRLDVGAALQNYETSSLLTPILPLLLDN